MRSLREKSLFGRFFWGFEAYSGIKITNAYRQAKWGGGRGFLIGKQNRHNTQCYRRVWRKENHFPGGVPHFGIGKQNRNNIQYYRRIWVKENDLKPGTFSDQNHAWLSTIKKPRRDFRRKNDFGSGRGGALSILFGSKSQLIRGQKSL